MPAGLTLDKVTVNGTGAVTVAFLCRVFPGHSAKPPDKIHSAKSALPINFLPCVLCRVQYSLCRVPQALGKEPESSSDYWWGGSGDDHRIHWLRWEELARHKSEGGMGFRDMHLFNKAMLGKQGWRLTTRPDSLCAKVLKGRYFHDGDFLGLKTKRTRTELYPSSF